ncbi:hypothetical protein G6F31_021042 [Rhizopus arrhizus]|nr:hypothetical protein G6F31_021042 [Rhizopus arrhizus]
MRQPGQRVAVGKHGRARGEDGFVQAQVLDVFGDGVAPVSMVVDDDDRHGVEGPRACTRGAPTASTLFAVVMLRLLVWGSPLRAGAPAKGRDTFCIVGACGEYHFLVCGGAARVRDVIRSQRTLD